MPSDSNGVYSLPSGYLAVTGETIQASQHNPPLEDLASSMTARLMRSGAAPMTGPLKLTDGSASAPSLAFANSSSTGVFKTANGIGIAVNGTQVAEIGAGGFITGARSIGELIPYTGTTAAALTVLPFGQTLSRTTYAALWTFAQAEIAAGNTFYNNGNGTTTFGIGDVRARVFAARSNMGGVDNGLLTGGFVMGAALGQQSVTLTTAQIEGHAHVGGGNTAGVNSNHFHSAQAPMGVAAVQAGGSFNAYVPGTSNPVNVTIGIDAPDHSHAYLFSTDAIGGGQAHTNIQPTIVGNYLLFAGA